MPNDLARGFIVAAVLSLAVLPGAGQSPALRIVSAGPSGELDQLADADQIRIVFSEPMVALGTVPTGVAPSWFRITPEAAGSFYWSGTRTLIFSPDATRPLPFATRFTVRVDATATSAAGRALGAPYELTFTTPTVRLLDHQWHRRTQRFDRPAIIILRFNQPVRPEDIVAHVRVGLTPHPWNPPLLSAEARQRLRQTDPAGLDRFDEKVAVVARVTSSTDSVAVRVDSSSDEGRFAGAPERLVLETIAAPPTDGWLTVTMDDTLPSAQGPEKHATHSTVVKLEPTFFVAGTRCPSACDPEAYNPMQFTRPVTLSAVARTITIADVTDRAGERPVGPVRDIVFDRALDYFRVQDIGFDQQPPARTWRLHLPADLEAQDGQTLGYPWVGFVENAHLSSFIAFGGSVWETSGGPQIPLNARNVPIVTQRITGIAAASLMSALLSLRDWTSGWHLLPEDGRETRRLSVTPDAVQAHGVDLSRLLSPGGTGVVLVAAAPGDPPRPPVEGAIVIERARSVRTALVQVTNLGISVKDSPQSTLVFVTRLDSGTPVPDARVAIVNTRNETMWRGATDRDGVALAPALALRNSYTSDISFMVTAEKDGDLAFVGSDWNHDTKPWNWNFKYTLDEADRVLRGRVFTDRSVYKETETVHVKAVVRDDTPDGMRLIPAGRALDVVVRDSRYREVDRRTIAVNRWSSAEWTWHVPENAALGHYQIAVSHAGEPESNPQGAGVGGEFLVAAYRRPDFRVDATLAAAPPIMGSTLSGAVDAKYLYGAALAGRPVRWWFARELVQRPPDAVRERFPEARYAVGYLPRGDERPSETDLPEETEPLGADGRTRIALPTTAEHDVAYSYRFEADVEDVSRQHIANRASLVVHPASLYVAMSRPPMFAETKAGVNIKVVAIDLFGKPVGDVLVTMSLLREEWASAPRWERREIPSGEWTTRTTTGETSVAIPVRDGGYYTLRATACDANGRRTRTDLGFYALGPGLPSWRGEGHRIELTPEHTTWKPGDKARILIQSPWPHATALLTVEREGIRSHRTFTVTSSQDTVEVPITEADVPNVYVSVMLVKGRTSTELAADGTDEGRPSYCVGYTQLTVDDSSKRLHVRVTADRDEYRPRQPMTVSVAVAERNGKPASAEVAIWAVDDGVLSLTNYTTPDVLKAIYAPKGLQVMTEDNRQLLMSRTPMVGPPDAAGGIDAMSASVMVTSADVADAGIRRNFEPLVFWLGSATTSADGRATTTVTLPDSLTTYRIMAVAGDQASRFGSGEHEIRVAKPLTLLPAFPRFLSKGDRASFGAVVTNSGKMNGSAVVTIQSLDPRTLRFGTLARRTFRLAPGASAPVKFDALARARGKARVRITVTLGADTDAFEMPLVVTEPMRPETTAAYGDTVATATEPLALPAGLLPGGGLTVELASTALVGLGESARYLDEYPYGCAEQKASRALALLLASDLGGAFTLSGIKPDQYRAAGTTALHALYAYQCPDGGFSYWAGGCGSESVYLTAYVLHALKVAETVQVPIDRNAVDSALGYLQRAQRQPPPAVTWWPVWGASQAYAVKVLAEFGRQPRDDISRLAGMAERLPIFALSYLADALAASGDKGPRYQDVVRRLTNALRIDADRAHVEEIDEDALAWLWNTNVRATGVVLEGLSRRKDDATFVAPLVRWLVAARTNGRWRTTHENAMALEALVAYYRAFENEVPRMTASVKLGSAIVGTAAFDGRTTTSQQVRMSMPDLLKQITAATSTPLSISRAGTGRVYYTARVQSFVAEPPDAVDRGFLVERRYEPYVKDGVSAAAVESSRPQAAAVARSQPQAATTTFAPGDLISVKVTVTLRGEGRYLALTDPLPAGFEPLEGWFETTASDLARQATRTSAGDNWRSWLRDGGFDHVEKHDDRVVAFATRLGSGRHEFSYLVRATTAGTFGAGGARVEAMYAPELSGRSQAATVIVRNPH